MINNEILQLARKSRKLTQKEAALQAGISQGKLSKAELGLQSLSEDDLQSLIALYDYPLSFFLRASDRTPPGFLYFRRKLSLAQKTLDSLIANTSILKMIVDDLIDAVEMPEYSLGEYNVEDTTPEDIAQAVRFKLNIHRGPVRNLTTLLENHGIIIIKFDFETDKIDGLSSITQKGIKVIFLNSSMPNDRIRFSLAHELGHMLMHLNTPSQFPEMAEDEADKFASEFLMPKNDIIDSLHKFAISDLSDLKRYWQVSMRAIIRRAKTLNTISGERYRSLQIDMCKRGYAKNEPIILPSEMPIFIRNVIDLHKDGLGYSDEDIMMLTRLNSADYRKWFGGNANIIQFKPKPGSL